MKNLIKLISVIFMALFCSQVANADPANDSTIILTFEGLKDQEAIRNFYNGGSGSKGSTSYADYGIQFSSNALALIDTDAGGSGNFGNEPSPDTVMYFLTGESAVLNKDDGFDTGFSFYYSAINNPGKVVVYDGLNAQGTALATINLPVTDSDGGDPNGDFSPFYQVGVSFPGTARSIDFGGTIDEIAFDDITFGSATPGVAAKIPFVVADFETNPIHSSRITSQIFDGVDLKEGFDSSLPTYVITHGWQNSQGKYDTPGFNFLEKELPDVQKHISSAIVERLKKEDIERQHLLPISKYGVRDFLDHAPGRFDAIQRDLKKIRELNIDLEIPVAANVITFEWEGAYTGILKSVGDNFGHQQARVNADYAGVLLGRALEEKLGKSYEKDLHFVGHSFGTVVNGIATRYLDASNTLVNINTQNIQFTVLDSPTNAGVPNLNKDWFYNNLSPKVDYVDNYYGDKENIILPFLLTLLPFSEPITGANINQVVFYDHSGVAQIFYPDLVKNGSKADTNLNIGNSSYQGLDIFRYSHQFDDWITPILQMNYSERPNRVENVTVGSNDYWKESIDYQRFNAAINRAYFSAELPGYSEYGFNGLVFNEQSPVSIYYSLDVPLGAEWLYFDWMVGNGGDGDWITVHFGSDLLWSMGISDFLEGILLNALLDISTYAGQSGNLWFTLNSVDEANASFYIGNLEFRGSNIFADSTVPEPATLTLLCVGLLGLYWARLRRKHRFN